ncbi:RNA polymerase sigma factor [Paenibacillus sp. sptzw28]|uniref:RNA polymerase sigma factor n=1 Tax=Paenibacillus sp. sptzw28 TaxID=715179 RepID=UPI001C6F16A7|nr:RNA polymerase sigma factor [Paenibacillus sp. sptzw28]QYR22604.1 RNA polymerase sigma factor [Paenibacillus sp. sptzw28]
MTGANVNMDEALVRRYSKRVFSFALARTGNRQEAEDLAQEIAIALIQSLRPGREIDNMDAWVQRICSFTWSNYVAKHKRHWRSDASIDEIVVASGDPSPPEMLVVDETMHLLQREVAFLTKRHREITVMHYFHSMNVQQIAATLHIPPGTVKWHLFEARKKLKEGLSMSISKEQLSYKPLRLGVGHCGTPGPKEEPNSYFTSLLAGNIAIAAYDRPLTIDEIARKVGAASAYVEEHVEKLKYSELMLQTGGGRFQTNFLIRNMRSHQQESAFLKLKAEEIAADFLQAIASRLEAIKGICFHGNRTNEKFLLWWLIPFTVHNQYCSVKDAAYHAASGPIERPDGGRYIAVGDIKYDEDAYKVEVENREIVRKYATNGIKFRENGGNLCGLQMESWWSGMTWREFDGPDLTDLGRIAEAIDNGRESSDYDKLTISRMAEKGLVTVEDGQPVIQIPFLRKSQYEKLMIILEEAMNEIEAGKKLESVLDGFVAIWEKLAPSHISKREINYFVLNQGMGIVFAIMEALVRLGQLKEPLHNEMQRLTTMVWEK